MPTKGRVGRFRTAAGQAEFEKIYDQGLDALPPPAEVQDVSTRFGQVRVYRFGDAPGPPIVLLHGRAATSVMWLPNLAALAERHRVFALDLLGEGGRSVQTVPIRNADDQAAWFGDLLERLDVGAAHLVGVSIGGWLACNQAVRAPRHVASISLLEPANTLGRIPLGLVLRTIPIALPFTASWAMPRFLRWVDGNGEVPEDDPVGRVIGANLRHYRAALAPPAYFSDDQLRSIAVPALVLLGGRSVVHDAEKACRRARALIPDVQAELWPDATHSIAGQYATEVNERVLRFINSVGAATPTP
ncbi:hypothetical protein Skr01_44880 [Sphaerisporangium krabiense]|uniref:Pimeloyl-ACP methyl ester carboxylesterase n=1 Tax=Sphaerisporangium krabiense TaxID=763782 RepID=A0A7W9DQW2_9ACTN|nr:alpha/beta fold hydrolase [Sphaerisporangium krabiense]MBB5627459.1 pimeloyl-ACP methyl ester carboxylesterase [Sphaerisporangium krabiense]GII64403.1 hypothetical protein Skr01_44880 [Sphaerisporangium krabiense]